MWPKLESEARWQYHMDQAQPLIQFLKTLQTIHVQDHSRKIWC